MMYYTKKDVRPLVRPLYNGLRQIYLSKQGINDFALLPFGTENFLPIMERGVCRAILFVSRAIFVLGAAIFANFYLWKCSH